jgi:hypothetical protein
MMAAELMISEELARFLEQGLSILIAVRDVNMAPYGVRVSAVAVDEDRTHVTAYIHQSVAAKILEHLKENGQVALGFSRPTDHRAYQVKGTFVDSHVCRPRERDFVQRQFEAFRGELEAVGIPPSMTAKWKSWPSVAVRILVTEVFAQTPGPGAGEAVR